MNDLYQEILVKQKKNSAASLIRAALIAATAVFALGAFFMHPVFLLPALALGILCWFYSSRTDREYEYLYVNGDFDIDVIYNRQKRKRVGSYDVNSMIVFAPERSHELDPYRKKPGMTLKDYSSKEGSSKVWCGVYSVDKGEEMVLLELEDDSIVKDLRRYAPRKVFLD